MSWGGSAPSSLSSLHFLPLPCPVPQLVEGNFALFCTYTLGFRNEFQNLLLAIMVSVGLKVGQAAWADMA